ncbi:MAG TPA: GTPase, partial [Bacteroidales bacterium]|nr:GTPase [Bacteroidales bacterium]
MGLNCGIVGLTGCGKTTLFNAFLRGRSSESQSSGKSNLGHIEVPDSRLDAIAAIVKPVKVVRTTVDIIDIPGLLKGSATQKGAGLFLSEIRQTDAIIHVLRCFDNPMVPHPEGSVDPLRDKETVDLELIAKDIGTLEKKIQRLDKMARVGEKDAVKGLSILNALLEHFENGEPARNFAVDEESKPYIDDCFFLTIKPVIYVCNVDEASAVSGNVHTDKVKPAIEKEGAEMILIA